ncbi:polysaccharide deacetylase family protein [Actinoplanes sp. GCM10030250]|uniref:polysaccharide deacetylase family protein n=1 Tax=Actinoplanes sp. GCM10030250 TaxID=3273376 RepID=UPI00360FD011
MTASSRAAGSSRAAIASFGAATSSTFSRAATRAARGTRPRHSRQADAPARSRSQRTLTGAHRSPGTLPVEAWLDAAKSRPQILLGTLVAAGLLLTAVPIQQPGGETVSVMNAAAQAVAARMTSEQPQQKKERKAEEEAPVAARPATQTTAPPAPEAAPTTAPDRGEDSPVQQVRVPKGDGPFNSLRTTGSQVVSLTFDDGPDPEQTPKILAMLDKYQIKAVFCLVGTQAKAHPDLVRQIVNSGHVLCNHTWSHDLAIGKKKADRIRADLDRTNAAIREAVPDAEIPFFRAPGGNFTDRLVKVAYGDEMTSLYWEVDPRDWEHTEGETPADHVKRIVSLVKKETRPGSIVLSHDFNQPTTIEAYEKLLPWFVDNFKIGLPGDTAQPAPSTPVTTAPTPAPSTTPETPAPTPTVTPTEAPAAGVTPSPGA